jgi:sphingomyelin phosphodiesterase acid-like 3
MYVLHASAQILDYTQYYLNLPQANSIGKANWDVEYSLLDYYELQEISAITLHDLADRFTQSNDYAFVRYVCDEVARSIHPFACVIYP